MRPSDDLRVIAIEIVIDARQTGGEPDPSWNRIQLGDHHAVLCGDNIGSDDSGQGIAKSFHPAVLH